MAEREEERVVKVLVLTCERCGYQWETDKRPKACAKCKSRYWNEPRGTLKLGRRPKGGAR